MSSPDRPDSLPPWLPAVLAATALAALAGPALLVANPPYIPPPPAHHPARVVPKAELPAVEPVAYQALAPADARAFNATVPFSTDPNPAARPFVLTGSTLDQARAIDCMAAAMLYEAGDDPVGQRAVGQVIINRARHPAFPKSICGVVFQGQERRTGCQFTFTCDGAMTRPVNPAAWERARVTATAALTGSVYAPVGHATHYHTDWVVPYWSASLDKITEVHTHLFFRWTGWWGTPPAFRRTVSDSEPVIAKLAALSPSHALGASTDDPAALLTEAGAMGALGETVTPTGLAPADPDTFLVTLDKTVTPDFLPAFARRACGERNYCKLMGWTDRKLTPVRLPLDQGQVATMAFSYLRDRDRNFDKPLWNCAIFPRTEKRDCMKVQVLSIRDVPPPAPVATVGAAPRQPAATTQSGPQPLDGVRRKPRVPVPSPSPTPRPTPMPESGR